MGERVEEVAAGREMDVFVAERVMGWRRAPYSLDGSGFEWADGVGLIPPGERTHITSVRVAPNFSTDMTAAFQMEERIRELGLLEEYGDALAYLVMDGTMWSLGRVRDADVYAIAHASPEQRCRAALRAVDAGQT